jgi:hypothetical protein
MISWRSRQREKTSRVGHEHIVGTKGGIQLFVGLDHSRAPVLDDSSRREFGTLNPHVDTFSFNAQTLNLSTGNKESN